MEHVHDPVREIGELLTAHLLRLHQKRRPKYLGLDHALAGPTFVSLALSGCERACVYLWAKAV